MNSRTSAAESSSPFRLRSISSTACIGASLFLGIDQEALRERDLPRLGAQPALGLVEQPLDLPVLARDTRSRDARALPDIVVVDLRDGRADAVLELRLRGAKVLALFLQRVRLREVELARENSDPAARHAAIQPDSSARSSTSAAVRTASISAPVASPRRRSSSSSLRDRPRSRIRRAFAVASIRIDRASFTSGYRRTSPSASMAVTSLLMVALVTCSAAASSVSDRAPPKTSTESAEARAGEIPIAFASVPRTRRRR